MPSPRSSASTASTDGDALPRSQRERQRLETRELLFELAIDEFRRVGTAKARIRDIVEAAGVVPGTFYFHFPSKDHVIHELWQRNSARLVELLLARSREEAPVGDFLRALGDAMIDVEQEVGDPELLRDSIAIVLRPPVGIDISDNPIGQVTQRFLASARQRGEIASDLLPGELTGILLTSLLGALAVASDDSGDRRRDLRRTIDFFLKALR